MYDGLFIEIFGNDDVKPVTPVSLPKTTPVLATDDDLFRFTPSTGSAAAISAQLADDALIAEVSGLTEPEVRKLNLPTGDHFQKRRTKEAKSRSAHEIHLAGIISRLRDDPKFEKIRFSDGWPRLLNSMTDFVLAEVGTV
jgi:hypothetical protein